MNTIDFLCKGKITYDSNLWERQQISVNVMCKRKGVKRFTEEERGWIQKINEDNAFEIQSEGGHSNVIRKETCSKQN